MIRFHSATGMRPFEKLTKYVKFSKNIVIFPVMILDKMIEIMEWFFPKSHQGGYYVLTNDQNQITNTLIEI